jgi:hypothetical protein
VIETKKKFMLRKAIQDEEENESESDRPILGATIIDFSNAM